MLRRGAFILFEGIDRSGKTTQSLRLVEALTAKHVRARHMRFPDRASPSGKVINDYLRGSLDTDDRAVHLLYSANRWEASKQLEQALKQGETVVCDRYAHSGVAFSAAKGLDIAWCKGPDAGLPKPDLLLLFDLSVDEAAKRGEYGAERYERRDFQEKVKSAYQRMKRDDWVVLDASKTPDQLAEEILVLADAVIARKADQPIDLLWD